MSLVTSSDLDLAGEVALWLCGVVEQQLQLTGAKAGMDDVERVYFKLLAKLEQEYATRDVPIHLVIPPFELLPLPGTKDLDDFVDHLVVMTTLAVAEMSGWELPDLWEAL